MLPPAVLGCGRARASYQRSPVAGGIWIPSEQQVGDHRCLASDLDGSALLEAVAVLEPLVGPFGDLDAAGQPLGLHTAGGVDGVTPQVVAELGPADDAGHHRAGVDA